MPDTSMHPVFEPLPHYREYPPEEMEARSRAFAAEMQRRRTTNPMGFLAEVLQRPVNERPVMLVVTGYPADGAQVPLLRRKPLREIATFR